MTGLQNIGELILNWPMIGVQINVVVLVVAFVVGLVWHAVAGRRGSGH